VSGGKTHNVVLIFRTRPLPHQAFNNRGGYIVLARHSVGIWENAVDKTVARLNIEHYRTLLAGELDATKRRSIIHLLAEEEAKLAALENRSNNQEHL